MVELIDNGSLIDNGGWNNERMKFTEIVPIRYQNFANDTQQSSRLLSPLSPAAIGTRLSASHSTLRSPA